jgi:hypothetical protein
LRRFDDVRARVDEAGASQPRDGRDQARSGSGRALHHDIDVETTDRADHRACVVQRTQHRQCRERATLHDEFDISHVLGQPARHVERHDSNA